MHLEALKAIVLVAMLVCTFLFSTAPLLFVSLARRNMNFSKHSPLMRSVGLLSCFAGGVFMATCLLDLFPDVRDKLSQVFDSMNWFSSFPIAEFVMSFGFFLVLIIEQITLSCRESGATAETGSHQHGHSHRQSQRAKPRRSLLSYRAPPTPTPPLSRKALMSNIQEEYNHSEDGAMHDGATVAGARTPSMLVVPPPQAQHADAATPLLGDAQNNGACPRGCRNRCCRPSIVGISDQPHPDTNATDNVFYSSVEMNSHLKADDEAGNDDVRSFSRSMILVLALSVHSVFEGLAVGLQSTAESVLDIFTALILHKCVLAFSLGLNLIQSDLSMFGTIRSDVVFSVTSPIGIAIGMGITDGSDSSQSTALAAGLLQGIACGTFLYVTFFEVLPHEMNSSQDRLLKVLSMIAGFSAVCGLLMLHSNVVRPTCYRGAEPV
ncbi:PREDICTED: zinc transporter ZIP1-like [Priapulus caudatus]|uniref:Zinc transporter ZIP1-like n=1 Tax=Priapulus caudatus TaxID=37621 RepID=A0ABM1DT95_PRICU|nr:PREDICTED: zinc transporter ZIP1-like [Priapulus caudatus]